MKKEIKIGEDWHCTSCGKFIKKIETGVDMFGYYLVAGKCPACVHEDPELSKFIISKKGGES